MPENIELPARIKSVVTSEPTNVTARAVTLNGNVSLFDSEKITCGFIYDTSSNLSQTRGIKKSTNANGAYVFDLSGLDPNTTYYYRAYAVDAGQYKYGTVCSFETNISVVTEKASKITYNKATLSGYISSSHQQVPCGIIYGTSPNLSSTIGSKKSTTSSGAFSIDVTGLSPNTTYYYCAYVVDDGEYRYGLVQSFQTKEGVVVTTGEASAITNTSATLEGVITNSEQTLACGFIYGTSSDLSSSIGTKINTTSSGDYSIKIKPLTADTEYYYRAYAIVDGEYVYGEVRSFTTKLDVLVTTGNATDITYKGAILSGSIDRAEQSLTCGIIYGTSSSLSSSNGTKKSTTSSSSYSLSITGLSANTTYYYRAFALVDGEYEYGEVRSFTTTQNISVTTGSATSITYSGAALAGSVSGSEYSLTCGIIYGTSSSLSSSNGTKKSTTSSSSYSISVTGLNANTTYYYRAYAIVDGEYKYGEVRSFTTNQNVSVTTGSATSVTYSSATLSGSISGSNYSLTCGIIYGTSSSLSSSNGTKKSTTSSGSYSISVTGLNANTTYYYRAYAIVDGEYKYGEVRSFTTESSSTVTSGDAIDLGLSVKWASCNVGAESPEEYGDYFAWGETTTKSSYNSITSITYDLSISELKSRGIIDAAGNLTAAYDAATANRGEKWRMPTLDEMKELISECKWEWTSVNGVNGRLVTGPNGNSIFLPAAGYRDYASLYNAGSGGYYWSATPNHNSLTAYNLYISSASFAWFSNNRNYGQAVRPVSEE